MNLLVEIADICAWYAHRCANSVVLCLKEIFRSIEDYLQDRKLGIRTCYVHSDLVERSLYQDEILYKPTSFHRIRKMMEHLKLGSQDVFVDIGCGKGRVVCMAAREPIKKVVGLELKKVLADTAEQNLSTLKEKKSEGLILRGDVLAQDLSEGTVFFMYDPFFFKTFSQVIENIHQSVIRFPRCVRIVYFDQRYGDYLDSLDWLKSEGEIGHTRIFVWTYKPS